jgi:PPOX class probable F420-dependent enzyme
MIECNPRGTTEVTVSEGRLRMTNEEVQDLLAEARRAQLATLNADGTIHVVPLTYFVDDDGRVAFWTPRRSRKVANLRRDPTATCLVEVGADYYDFRAAQVYGRGQVIDDPERSVEAGVALFHKYGNGEMTEVMDAHIREMAADRVLVLIEPDRVVTWDHRKLAGLAAGAG